MFRILSRRGQPAKFILGGALVALLGACASDGTTTGGGMSGGLTNPPSGGGTTPPPSTVDYNTAEYRANWGLGAINAIAAYQDGATGKGITAAVIDSGLDTTHPEFVGHYDPASTNVADPAHPTDLTDVDGHGTLVSGIIAAKKNDVGMHGVAFDANLLVIKADDPGSCTAGGSTCNFFDTDIATGVNYAVAHGAKVINISLGGDNAPGITLRNAMDAAVQQGVIIVIAAGNDYDATKGTGTNPTLFAQYADQASANGQVIIAGAATQAKQIASYSNRAGSSQNVYLLAPADGVYTTDINGGYTSGFGGTSLATPHIVGAVALMLQAFPSLTAQQIVHILLTTATDEGAVGPDAINGMGFLDIAAAFAPQGTLTVSMSPQTTQTSAQSAAVGASLMSLGPAFGDALSAASGPLDAVALDDYNRAYTVDLNSRVTHLSEDGLWSRGLVSDFRTAWSYQRLGPSASIDAVMFNANADAPVWREVDLSHDRQDIYADQGRVSSHFSLGKTMHWTLTAGRLGERALSGGNDPGAGFLTGLSNDSPYLSLVERGTGVLQDLGLGKRVSLLTSVEFGKRRSRIGQEDIGTTAAMAGVKVAASNWSLTPKVGFLSEHGGILGGSSIGLFSLDSSAVTRFVGLNADLRVSPAWSLHADGTAGWTSVNGAEGLWSSFSTISTSAFRIFAAGNGLFSAGDSLTFGIGQPLRVESGRANVVLPTSYNYATESFGYSPEALNLSPTGREIDFEAVYALPLGNGWSARANLIHRQDAGHIAGASDSVAALQFHTSW